MIQLLLVMLTVSGIFLVVGGICATIAEGFRKLKALFTVPPRQGNTDFYGRQITRTWNR